MADHLTTELCLMLAELVEEGERAGGAQPGAADE
jgi:hypothetical protein